MIPTTKALTKRSTAIAVIAGLALLIGLHGSAQSATSCQPGTTGCVGTLAFTSWTHGSAVLVEDPSRIFSLFRRGFGAEVLTRAQTWVHFAVPTPGAQLGTRLRLRRIRVLWDGNRGSNVVFYTNPPIAVGARIVAMHVWDGDVKLAEFGQDYFYYIGQPYAPGIAWQDLRTNVVDVPGTPYVYYGVIVSLLVDAPLVLDLKSVGADFYTYASTTGPGPSPY